MFSWTALPNETLKLKKKRYITNIQVNCLYFYCICNLSSGNKKKMINKLKNTLKYNDKA